MATELAKAYVQILPSAKGISGSIAGVLDGEAASAGKSAGLSIAGAIKGAIAAAGIGTMIKSILTTGSGFEAAISQVSATMGKAAQEMISYGGETVTAIEAITSESERLGASTAFTAAQAAEGYNVLAMAGYDAERQISELPAVLDLAQAGAIDIATAADYTTGILAGMGDETLTTAKTADYLAVMASSAKGSVSTFGDALSTVAGMGKTTGQSLETLAVASEILGNHNYAGAEAGNALNRVLRNIYQATGDSKTALDSLIGSAYTAEGEARPLEDVLLDLNQAMDGWSDQAKNEYLSKIFDAVTLKSVPFLIDDVTTSWANLAEGLENSEGAAAAMSEEMRDNLQGDVSQLTSALEGLQIALFNLDDGNLRALVQAGTAGLSGLTDIIKNGLNEETLGALKQGLLNAFSVESFAELGTNIASGLQFAFLTAIQMTGEGLSTFVSLGTDIVRFIASGLSEGIPDFLSQALPMLTELTANFRENFGQFVDAGIELVMDLAQGLIAAIPDLVAYVPEIVINIAGLINDNAPKLLEAGFNLIVMLAKGIITNIPVIVQNIPQIFKAIVAAWTALNWIDLGTKLIKFISSGIKSLASNIPQVLSSIGKKAGELFKSINWKSLGSSVINFIITGLKSIGSTIGSTLYGLATGAWNTFLKINWLGLGKDVVLGIASGITNAGKFIIDAVLNAAKGAFEGVKKFFGISSPSKLMRDEVGKQIVAGMAVGVEKNANMLNDALSDVMGDATVSATKAAQNLADVMSNTVAGGINDMAQAVGYGGGVMVEFYNRFSTFTEHLTDTETLGAVGAAVVQLGQQTYEATQKSQEAAEKAKETNEETKDILEETAKAFIEMQQSVTDSISSQIDIFSEFDKKTDLTSEKLLENMASQIEGVSEWASNMETLAERGVDQGLLQKLGDLGPRGYEYVNAFVTMTDSQLQQANQLFAASLVLPQTASNQIIASYAYAGMMSTAGFIEGVTAQADEAANTAANMAEGALNAVKDTLGIASPSTEMIAVGGFMDEGLINGIKNGGLQVLNQAQEIARNVLALMKEEFSPDRYEEIGRQAARGIAAGIDSNTDSIASAARKAAKAALNAAKDFLGIHSPSSVMRDSIGRWIPEGIAEGITENVRAVTDAVNDVASMAAATDISGVGFAAGIPEAAGSTVNITMNIYGAEGQNVKELADVIQREMYQAVAQKGAVFA